MKYNSSVLTFMMMSVFFSGCFLSELSDNAAGIIPPKNAGSTPSISWNSEKPSANGLKKADFLFVIDDSLSNLSKHTHLVDAFSRVAQILYQQNKLDVCTAVISSSRRLGKTLYTNSSTYFNEASNIGCSHPPEIATWTPEQRQTQIEGIMQTFKTALQGSSSGNGFELLGKSLVTFLTDAETWSLASASSRSHSFFRPKAQTVITFITDENNYYRYSNSTNAAEALVTYEEPLNDIPAAQGTWVLTGTLSDQTPVFRMGQQESAVNSTTPLATTWTAKTQDQRKGIKNYLDEFFTRLNPGSPLQYSVIAIIRPENNAFGLSSQSQNLKQLVELVGRNSTQVSIDAAASDLATLYSNLLNSLSQSN
ncbi:MAG: hypothetical protein ACO3A2_09660 [Bdellovibrionia bacterium]